MKKREISWLYSELPKLISKGIITSKNADAIKNYYGKVEKKDFSQLLLVIFGIIGSLCVGLGIILLFAYNWNELSRLFRTVIIFILLISTQAFTAWVFFKRKESVVLREISTTLLMLIIGAVISLISQTYHISGDFGNFILTWMLLSIPLVYLLDSNTPVILYFIGITTWSGYVQYNEKFAVLFWGLLVLALPHIVKKYREKKYSGASINLTWGLVIVLIIAIGITLEKVLPGLWIVIYAGYFSVIYIVGKIWFDDAPGLMSKPFHFAGTFGIIVLAFLLTYSWPWEDIGWNNIRFDDRFNHYAAIFDYIITFGIIGSVIILSIVSFFKKQFGNLYYTSFVFIVILGYIFMSIFSKTSEYKALFFNHLLMNSYLLILGISTIVYGFKTRKIYLLNGGTIIIAVLISLRFIFVEDMFENLVFRGIIFIILGIGFFATNIVLSKNFKKQENTDEK